MVVTHLKQIVYHLSWVFMFIKIFFPYLLDIKQLECNNTKNKSAKQSTARETP